MDHLIIFWLLFGVYLIKNVWDLYLKFRQVGMITLIPFIGHGTTHNVTRNLAS